MKYYQLSLSLSLIGCSLECLTVLLLASGLGLEDLLAYCRTPAALDLFGIILWVNSDPGCCLRAILGVPLMAILPYTTLTGASCTTDSTREGLLLV